MGRIKALLNAFPETPMPRLAHRLFPLGLALIVTALVAGCQLSAPGTGAGRDRDVTPNAVAGDAIEVTALDAPPSASAPETAGAVPATAEGPAAREGQTPTQAASRAEEAAPLEAAGAQEAAAEPAPQPAAVPAAPEELKSDAQRTCEKRGGTWSGVGSGVLRTCVYETKDAGKRCERESQCEGVCLARSNSCSPITPLLGCHEVLQDNGARVTLCIE
jgi:hypothetical protein